MLHAAPGDTLRLVFTSPGPADPAMGGARPAALARTAMERDATVRAEVPLRLDQLAEQACEELAAGPHVVTTSLEASVVTADPALVRIAVRNLLDNALRHGRTPAPRPPPPARRCTSWSAARPWPWPTGGRASLPQTCPA